MFASRFRLFASAILASAIAAPMAYDLTPRGRRMPRLMRKRGYSMKYRQTKRAFNPWKRNAKRKAERRARRITRMYA